MKISVGRGGAAMLFALALPVGCSSKEASKSPNESGSMLCRAPDDCARGDTCGCAGMDPGCDCERCQQDGACHMDGGFCRPTSDDDCQRPGGACALFGFCHLVMTGAGAYCLPVSDDDCRSSAFCARWGSCGFDQELQQCFATSIDDCAVAEGCSELGCCSLVGTECVTNDGTCPDNCTSD